MRCYHVQIAKKNSTERRKARNCCLLKKIPKFHRGGPLTLPVSRMADKHYIMQTSKFGQLKESIFRHAGIVMRKECLLFLLA